MQNSPQRLWRIQACSRPIFASLQRRFCLTTSVEIPRDCASFGFTNPVLVSSEGEIIAGHGRVEAARQLGWKTVPTISLAYMSEAERRAA